MQFYKIKKGYNKKKNVLDLNLVEINLNNKEFKIFMLEISAYMKVLSS